jgi:hypothetical protein
MRFVVGQQRKTRRLIAVLGLGLGVAGLLGCGDAVDPDRQPRIGGERFVEIRFDDLFRPSGAVAKERATVDLVQTETLSIEGVSPESVVKTYAQELTSEGWTEVAAPEAKRDRSWYGAWTKMGRNVVVTAEEATPTEEGAAVPTEFELRFQRPTKTDQITGIENEPITG